MSLLDMTAGYGQRVIALTEYDVLHAAMILLRGTFRCLWTVSVPTRATQEICQHRVFHFLFSVTHLLPGVGIGAHSITHSWSSGGTFGCVCCDPIYCGCQRSKFYLGVYVSALAGVTHYESQHEISEYFFGFSTPPSFCGAYFILR